MNQAKRKLQVEKAKGLFEIQGDRTNQVNLPREEGGKKASGRGQLDTGLRYRCPRCCSKEPRRPLAAKALQKTNQEPGELAVQASPALSRRWACPRGPSSFFAPTLKPHGSNGPFTLP